MIHGQPTHHGLQRPQNCLITGKRYHLLMEHPRTILDRFGLQPKQSLGQNFLWDENILNRIIQAAPMMEADAILEIGPGLGHLTEQLARKVKRVVAVELDKRFLPILAERMAATDNVEIIHGDILDQDLGSIFPTGRYHAIANVPYYITGAILRHLMEASRRPTSVVLTVQKEVAQRMSAAPGAMSLMAVNVQRFGKVDLVGTIKAGNFWPRPDVDSAIVRIDLRDGPTVPLANDKRFMQIVKAGFAQKRKMLRKNLRSLGISQAVLARSFERSGVSGSRRAESLAMHEWQALISAILHGGVD